MFVIFASIFVTFFFVRALLAKTPRGWTCIEPCGHWSRFWRDPWSVSAWQALKRVVARGDGYDETPGLLHQTFFSCVTFSVFFAKIAVNSQQTTCRATPQHATPRHTTPHHATPHTTPHHTAPHHATPHTTPFPTTPHHTTPHHTPHHTTPHHTTPHHTTPHHTAPHHTAPF